MNYHFIEIQNCEMCNDATVKHKIMGQRMNQSLGFSPYKKKGISVTIQKCSKCNLIYPNPQPIPFNIQDHYSTPPEDYWISEDYSYNPDYFKTQIIETKKLVQSQNTIMMLESCRLFRIFLIKF